MPEPPSVAGTNVMVGAAETGETPAGCATVLGRVLSTVAFATIALVVAFPATSVTTTWRS